MPHPSGAPEDRFGRQVEPTITSRLRAGEPHRLAGRRSRLVNVSSAGRRCSTWTFAIPNFERTP